MANYSYFGSFSTVSSDQANSGTQSVVISPGINGIKYIDETDPGLDQFQVSVRPPSNTGTSDAAWIYLFDDAGQDGQSIQFQFDTDSQGNRLFQYEIHGGSYTDVVLNSTNEWTPEQWNSITVNMDHSASNFDVSLNGVEIVSDAGYSQTTSTINGTWLIGADTGGDAYYDDLSLSQIPEPGSLVLMGLGGLLVFGRGRRKSAVR